jgi:hypothetical protein
MSSWRQRIRKPRADGPAESAIVNSTDTPHTGGPQVKQIIKDGGYATNGGIHQHFRIDQLVINTATLSEADARTGHAALLQYQLEEIHRRQQSRLGANPEYILPQYFFAWTTYAEMESWKQRVVRILDEIESALTLGQLPRFVEEFQQWRRKHVDTATTNAVVLTALSMLDTTALGRTFTELGHRGKDTEATYLHADGATQWIARQINEPEFELALCVAGLFGSGKSRLLTEIAKHETVKGQLVIWVRPQTPTDTIVTAVERYLAEATGRSGIGLGDLDKLLRTDSGDAAPVTFLVDDLDSWARVTPTVLDELHRLVDHLSRYDEVRWVFAAEMNWLDVVTPATLTWRSIAFRRNAGAPGGEVSALERASGWLDLDVANRAQGLGLKILQKTGFSLPELEAADRDRTAFSFEFTHLYTPLNAVMRLAAFESQLEAAESLTDVNSVHYVQSYWDFIKNVVARTFNTPPVALEASVRGIAKHYCGQPAHDLQLPTAEASDHAIVKQLATTGLIRILTHGDELIEELHYTLTTDFPSLWGYRVSRFLGSAEDLDVSPWWALATDGSWIAESTCQFVLSEPAGIGDGNTRLWRDWAADKNAPKAPMFLAAASLPESDEVRIATDCIKRRGFTVGSKRELFALLRFLTTAKDPRWTGPGRLRVMIDLLSVAADYQLDPYLEWALSDVLGNKDLINSANYRETLLVLDRLPDGHWAYAAAAALARRGSLFETDKEWAAAILDYCIQRSNPYARSSKLRARNAQHVQQRRNGAKNRRKRAPVRSAPVKVPLELTENKPDFTKSFPGYLTSMVASMLVEGDGHVALRMLAQIGWWTAEEHHVDLKLAQYMRSTLTTAYGSTIHYTNREDLIDEYVAVVRELLAGRLLTGRSMAANNAYYLIKHSEPTRGKHDVRVRPVFHSFLDRIGDDPELMQRLGPGAVTLIQANLGRAPGTRTR